jgi:predicted metal-dependent hydrolase
MESLPQEFWEGVEQFNTGQFYACHDTLEALWIEALEPEKTFYQGILQIAVALYHLGNNNVRGAAILLGEGSNRLRRYPASYAGIDVNQLLHQSKALLSIVQQISLKQDTSGNLLADANLSIPQIVMVLD